MEENKELEQDLKTAGILIERLQKVIKPKEELKKLDKANRTFNFLIIILLVVLAFVAAFYLFNAGFHAGVDAASHLIDAATSYYSEQ